jgi:hydroxyacylglutathione hydrolase
MEKISIMKLETRQVADRVWLIQGPANELMYLVAGDNQSMLVDTGMGVGDLAGTIRELTDLPLFVVNTHGHPDHAGGNPAFEETWLHPDDTDIMREMCTDEYRLSDMRAAQGPDDPAVSRMANAMVRWKPYNLKNLQAGQWVDLGGRRFEVVAVPGHTPGCICLLNSAEKMIFVGDTVVATPAWLYLKHSLPLRVYRESLIKLRERENEFDLLFPGHPPSPLGREYLYDLIACAEDILASPGRGAPTRTFVGEGLLWQHGVGTIIYNPENL